MIDIKTEDRKQWLSELELKRYEECVKEFGTEGFLYYITETCPGAGYEIWYSVNELSYPYNSAELHRDTVRNITDIDNMLEKF